MKINVSLLLAMLALSQSATAADIQPQINVTGTAEIKVAPDEVDLRFTVETREKTLPEAQRQNDELMGKAIALLKELKVEEKQIQTDHLAVEPVFDPYPGVDPNTGLPGNQPDRFEASTKPMFYVVRKGLSIKLTNLPTFDAVLSRLLTNGVNHVAGIHFGSSQLQELKNKARTLAARDARQKAQDLTAELGAKLGRPIGINAMDSGSWYYGGFGAGGGGGADATTANKRDAEAAFAAGEITVSASVQVTFLME